MIFRPFSCRSFEWSGQSMKVTCMSLPSIDNSQHPFLSIAIFVQGSFLTFGQCKLRVSLFGTRATEVC
jgi:hypothetical protein